MSKQDQQVLARIVKAPHIRNPFVGKKDRWYRISAADMRVLKKVVRHG